MIEFVLGVGVGAFLYAAFDYWMLRKFGGL